MKLVDRVIDFENGDLEEDEILALFQELIDTDVAWKLQGFYGRMAASLIESGQCKPKERYDGEREAQAAVARGDWSES